MNYSKISYEQIVSLAEQLKNVSQNMEGLLGEVANLLNKIGGSDVWTGTAAMEAKAKFDALIAKFPEFSDATSKCHLHLISVVENYKSVDASISAN